MPHDLPPPLVVQIVDWNPYVSPAATWRPSDLPVTMALAGVWPSGVTEADANAAIDLSMRAWSLPSCTSAKLSLLPTRALASDGAMDGRNDVIVHLADWPTALEAGAVAHTVIYVSGDRIVEADVHVNAKDYSFSLSDVPGKIDLQSVLTHELGHVLGIGHSDDKRATMAAGVPAGVAARSLEDDDVAAVCALYPSSSTLEKGCDHGTPAGEACPSSYACVGHVCEREGEPSMLGAPCASSPSGSSARRCEGAGDRARCVTTSLGERCALPCPAPPASCGQALHCETLGDGTAQCIPDGATIASSGDGGVDARGDARGDAMNAPPSSSSGCSTTRARVVTSWWMAIAIAILLRRRFRP